MRALSVTKSCAGESSGQRSLCFLVSLLNDKLSFEDKITERLVGSEYLFIGVIM